MKWFKNKENLHFIERITCFFGSFTLVGIAGVAISLVPKVNLISSISIQLLIAIPALFGIVAMILLSFVLIGLSTQI